jgi:hypothetical protein
MGAIGVVLKVETSSSACRNCGAQLSAAQRFCGACSQKTHTPRLTMRENARDFLHAVTHADHSIFSLVRGLAVRPGHVARDFVAGKRKRHFGPWAFLIITVGLASAVILISGVQWFEPFGHGRAGEILQRHVNLVILIQMPLLAAFCISLFRRARLHYAEHLVLAAYTSGFHALFLAVIETPLLAISGADTAAPAIAAGYFGVWVGYFAFAASQFYSGNRFWSFAKAIIVALLAQAATIAAVMVCLFLLSRWNDA